MINPVLRTSTGRPLRYCSVEVQPEGKYMTDPNGQVWIPKRSGTVKAKIWAETPAGRILNGEKYNLAYTQDVTLTSSGVVTVTDENNAFTLSQTLMDFLLELRKAFPRWASQSFGEDTGTRIEVSWPDKLGQKLPFVEPTSSTGFPLIHYTDAGGYSFPSMDVMKHEYAHAFHFSLVPHPVRDWYKLYYLGWLLTNLHDPYHNFEKVTTESVAWVEAWAEFWANEGDPAFRPKKDGEKIEGAICNLLFRRFAPAVSPRDPGLIHETFIRSEAGDLMGYAKWLAQWNPAHYAVFKQIASTEFHITLP